MGLNAGVFFGMHAVIFFNNLLLQRSSSLRLVQTLFGRVLDKTRYSKTSQARSLVLSSQPEKFLTFRVFKVSSLRVS